MWLRTCLLLISLWVAAPLMADTVWLNNGDRLSGEIILLDGGKLSLKTKYAGQVLINWSDIETLSSEQPLLIRRQGLDSKHSKQLAAAGKGMVRITDVTTQTVPLASVTRLVPAREFLQDFTWEGNLDAKLDLERKDDKSDEFRLKGDTRIEQGRWRQVMNGEYERETKNDRVTDDNWNLEYDIDRFLTEHWFWRLGGEQQVDHLEFVEKQQIIGTGPGYRFWDDSLGRFDLIGQVNHVKFDYPGGDLSFRTFSLVWDYKRLLWGTRLEFYTNAEVQFPEISEIDYVYESEFGLRYRLNDWARVSILYELDRIEAQAGDNTDENFLIGVGVGW
ncbi:DUF481 domain-containing protein [Pseudomonas sp.]|uniref:DUF481 domain-containing protein n=1 Tax=Pseudomonas sp. TaxID=306 RepID=UPI003A97A5CB